jgi:hypothetical protein
LLGCVDTEPTYEANQFATALMEADVGTQEFDYKGSTRRGGMLHKVIRWAFEKQGLYQISPSGPENRPGDPEPVDIYIDNRCGGEYDWKSDWSAPRNAIWIRHAADGKPADQEPRPGQTNYVYVVLENRGAETARLATVEVFAAVGAVTSKWDRGRWYRLQPAVGAGIPADVPPKGRTRFGPFEWVPQRKVRNALLASATVDGDRSNIDLAANLPCADGPVAVIDLVPSDNNLGYRRWPAT